MCVQQSSTVLHKRPMNYILIVNTFLGDILPGDNLADRAKSLKHLRLPEWLTSSDKDSLKPLVYKYKSSVLNHIILLIYSQIEILS